MNPLPAANLISCFSSKTSLEALCGLAVSPSRLTHPSVLAAGLPPSPVDIECRDLCTNEAVVRFSDFTRMDFFDGLVSLAASIFLTPVHFLCVLLGCLVVLP